MTGPRLPTALVVAGMHRSGTSAMTRALALCGLDLPHHLVGGRDDNPDGFWESAPVGQANDAILGELDSAWDDSFAARPSRIGRHSQEAAETLRAVLNDQFALDRDFVVKDPRISVLFPVWREALDGLDVEPRLIVMVRHPLEVAASLGRRNGFPAVKSALLWLSHLIAVERDSRGMPRVFVSYDALLQNWRRTLKRVERVLDFRLPQWNDAAEIEIDSFLSSDRRHHRFDRAALDDRADLPAWIAPAYDWALAAAGADAPPDAAALDRIAREFHAAADMFAPLVAFERRSAPGAAGAAADASGTKSSHFNVCIYSATARQGFDEATAVRRDVRLGAGVQTFTLTTPAYADAIQALRFDPADAPGRYFVHSLRVRTPDGAVLWEWDGEAGSIGAGSGLSVQGGEDGPALFEFANDDPQFIVVQAEQLGGARQVSLEVSASLASDAAIAEAALWRERSAAWAERVEAVGAQVAQLSDDARAMGEDVSATAQALADLGARLDHVAAAQPEHERAHGEMALRLDAVDRRLGEVSAAALDSVRQHLAQLDAQSADRSAAAAAGLQAIRGQIENRLLEVKAGFAALGAQQAMNETRADAGLATLRADIDAHLVAMEAADEERAQRARQESEAFAARLEMLAQRVEAAAQAQEARAREDAQTLNAVLDATMGRFMAALEEAENRRRQDADIAGARAESMARRLDAIADQQEAARVQDVMLLAGDIKQLAAGVEARFEGFNPYLADIDKRINALGGRFDGFDPYLADIDRRLQAIVARADAAERSSAAGADKLRAEIKSEFKTEMARLGQSLQQMQMIAAGAEASGEARAAQLAALLSRRIEAMGQAIGQRADLSGRLDALSARVDARFGDVEALIDSQGEELAREFHSVHRISEHVVGIVNQRDDARLEAANWKAHAAALQKTASWRLTAPLRALRSLTPTGLKQALRGLFRGARDRRVRKPKRAPAAPTDTDKQILARSELWDAQWYLNEYKDIREAGIDPLEHYLRYGGLEGRAPGPRFDSRWYLAMNPEVAAAGTNPLYHYEICGRKEGRAALPPSRHAPKSLAGHLGLLRSPRHWGYLSVSAALGVRTLLPLQARRKLLRGLHRFAPTASSHAATTDPAAGGQLFDQLFSSAAGRGEEYVPLSASSIEQPSRIKTIAFYLPQFHPIPENDAWWGKGFTEWTNVSKAVPQFIGHYQPRLPDELGFYDLRIVEVQRRQVELAKQYGIHGFCFHYYWFTGGKRLLERPLNQFVASDIDFPFCVCWANENWTRRWDGEDNELLMEQRHEPQDDLEVIADLAPLLRDPRYVRVDGRPVIIVYRVGIIPDPQRMAQIWRDYCRANGIGDPYLVAAQSFGLKDPRPYGFDAAVEFPPHNNSSGEITAEQSYINPGFDGRVFSYPHVVERESAAPWPDYTLFRTLMPSWDNEARKPGKGHIFAGSTPELYRRWLEAVCQATDARYSDPDHKLVFINAWNEWAEGAYLEPDRRFGYAYLDATRRVMAQLPADTERGGEKKKPPLVLVSHDAFPAGAQHLTLSIARELRQLYDVHLVLLDDGALVSEFKLVAHCHELHGQGGASPAAQRLALQLRERGARSAIVNSAVSGDFAATLKQAGLRVVSLVHELPGIVRSYGLEARTRAIAATADAVVFAAEPVRAGFQDFAPLPEARAIIRPQGLYRRINRPNREALRAAVRWELDCPPNAQIALCVGHADHRKGIDLFVAAALAACARDPSVHFVWLGQWDEGLEPQARERWSSSPHRERIHFPGRVPLSEVDRYYLAADVYLLTSREDPFPTVVLEALDAGLPVIAFHGSGGSCALIAEGYGLLAPFGDAEAMADMALELLADPERRAAMGEAGRARVARDFSFRRYVFDIAALADPSFKRVSAVVPNYNYARYMPERFASVQGQSAPVYEIVALDDCSQDDSAAVLERLTAESEIDAELLVNERNSGSACRQWLKGVQAARGDIVWIAEADDLCEPDFLDELLPCFDDPEVVMAYCQSQQMGPDGEIQDNDYLAYVADIDREKWTRAHVVAGVDEIENALAVKNTIPNVSACLFRREALLGALEAHIEEIARYRIAGDWAAYARVLERGKLAFSPRALNKHRRHPQSVTVGSFNAGLLREILSMQQAMRTRHFPTARALATARAYAQELYLQFGLNTPEAPDIGDSAEFAIYLEDARAAE